MSGPGSRSEGRSVGEIRAEIEARFGFLPPFFGPALDRATVLDNLWQQTKRSYVGNTLPRLLLERLFAVLSRFCDVPYCVVCHSCALRPLGMDAGQILTLLDGPGGLPDPDEAAAVLAAAPPDLPGWAQPGPVADAAVRTAVSLFLRDGDRARLAPLLRRVVPAADLDQLVLFLGYVSTCLEWVETHPELSYDADLRASTHLGPLLAEQPALRQFFADYTRRRDAATTGSQAVLAARAAEADRRFTLAFDHAPIGMALVDLQGRFLRVNHALCQILGRTAEALTATTLTDVTHPDDRAADLDARDQMIAGRLMVYRADKRYRHGLGSWVLGRLSATLLHAGDGAPLHFVTQIEDVTELRAQSTQLDTANAELRRSNHDLEQFAAVVAHDLKGPLAVVAGHAALLAEDLPFDAPHARDTAERIAATVTRMATLVDDLLAYARAGTEEIPTRWVDLDALTGDMLTELAPQLTAANAQVRIGHLGGVWAHPTHLRQVFCNLITNAVKYTAAGTSPRVEITGVEYDDDVVYTVADNGLGVPPRRSSTCSTASTNTPPPAAASAWPSATASSNATADASGSNHDPVAAACSASGCPVTPPVAPAPLRATHIPPRTRQPPGPGQHPTPANSATVGVPGDGRRPGRTSRHGTVTRHSSRLGPHDPRANGLHGSAAERFVLRTATSRRPRSKGAR